MKLIAMRRDLVILSATDSEVGHRQLEFIRQIGLHFGFSHCSAVL